MKQQCSSFCRIYLKFTLLKIIIGLLWFFLMSNRSAISQWNKETKPIRSLCGIVIPKCGCVRKVCVPFTEGGCLDTGSCSSCSSEATLAGPGQKVISYTHFVEDNKDDSSYTSFSSSIESTMKIMSIRKNLQAMKKLYPGWIMRVYTNQRLKKKSNECDLVCNNPEIFWCDVSEIPVLGNLEGVASSVWKFLPLGDPLVDTFLSRDLDNILGTQDRDAVHHWEKSDKAFHFMINRTDTQKPRMLGGVWGAKQKNLGRNESLRIQKQILKGKISMKKPKTSPDEVVLKTIARSYLENALVQDVPRK